MGGNGIVAELDSDHELVATEDYSEETILVSDTFLLSVYFINKERSGTQRQSFALQNFSWYCNDGLAYFITCYD